MIDKLLLGTTYMKPKIKMLLAALLAFGLFAAGCNGDEENNGGGDTGMTEDASEDIAEDTGDDAEEEDTADDTGDEDTASEDTGEIDRLQIASLYWRRQEQNCSTSSCTFGVRFNAIAGRITKVDNGQGLERTMSDSDTDAAIADLLTEATYDKMENGWDCGTVDSPEVPHLFEARIWNGNDYVEVIQDVTGCIGENSTAADAAEVQRIITYLKDLRTEYFPEQ